MTTFRPTSAEETRDAVRWALSAGEPLEVVGGATKRAIAGPHQSAHTLDLSGLSGIVAYEPEELVLTLRPGTPMHEVEAELDAKNQMLAFEPPDFTALLGVEGRPTIGGTYATNFSGPRRLSAGAVRDHALGVSAVAGRGEVFKAGGRVVKNVTGYDLARALAGSWGTLAVTTELTLKVLPKPETERTLALLGLAPKDAVSALSHALSLPVDVSAAAHLPVDVVPSDVIDGAPTTLLRLEGFGPSVDARLQHLQRHLTGEMTVLGEDTSRALWGSIRDLTPFAGTGRVIWRCSVAPTAGPTIAEAAPAGSRVMFDWAGGLVTIETPPEADGGAKALRGAIERAGGGNALLLRAPVDIRAAVPTFPTQDGALGALGGRLRAAFDPEGVFGSGRLAHAPAA